MSNTEGTIPEKIFRNESMFILLAEKKPKDTVCWPCMSANSDRLFYCIGCSDSFTELFRMMRDIDSPSTVFHICERVAPWESLENKYRTCLTTKGGFVYRYCTLAASVVATVSAKHIIVSL